MIEKNAVVAEAYYKAMSNKDLSGMAKYLHPEVHFVSPFADLKGQDAFLDAVKGFMSYFKTLTIRTQFEVENQSMSIYDVDFSDPIGIIRTAALMTFKDNLIIDIELFFDPRSLEKK